MKNLINLKNFINYNNSKKKIRIPKIGDNISIKYIYINGLKNVKFYAKTFYGRCIAVKRKNLNTSLFVLRNVFNRDPIELSFFLNSPFTLILKKRKKKRYSKFSKNKLYYLKYKKIAQSKIK